MNFLNGIEYFFNMIYFPIVVIFGILANVIIIVVLSRKAFDKTPSRSLLRILAASDLLAVLGIIPYYGSAFGISLNSFVYYSNFCCKLAYFWLYYNPAVSSWLLVMISVERFIFIRYRKVTINQNRIFITCIVIFIFIWNLLIYTQIFANTELIESTNFTLKNISINNNSSLTNQSSRYFICDIINPEYKFILGWVDMSNSALFPFLINSISTILLIHSIIISRRKILANGNSRNNSALKKDIQFSLVIVTLNIAFIFLNMPINIFLLNGYHSNTMYLFLAAIFYFQFIFNILVYIFFNKIFKKELLKIFTVLKYLADKQTSFESK